MESTVNMTQDYFVRNLETGKVELHFARETYAALDEGVKKRIKGSFLWGRNSGCWISRCKEPNLYMPLRVAKEIGLADAGETGRRMSFAEQMDRKAERAGQRAERFEAHARAAERRGEELQKPINDMHGDIAFFTQPNINTSGGRAFTRRRERMFEAYEKGFAEFRRSEYWASRAETARATASREEFKDKGFVMRRISERESDIRKLEKLVRRYEHYVTLFEKGRTPFDEFGSPVTMGVDRCRAQLERYTDVLESKLDELGYYQDCLDALGGVEYSRDNLKKGDLITISSWREPVRYVRGGPKNFTYEFTLPHMVYADGSPMQGRAAYAEITGRVEGE